MIIASPYIRAHRIQNMLERNFRNKTSGIEITPRFKEGMHYNPDGSMFVAVGCELIYYDKVSGAESYRERNPLDFYHTFDDITKFEIDIVKQFDEEHSTNKGSSVFLAPRDTDKDKWTADDAIIETYIYQMEITGYFAKEARETWRIYKEVVGKPLVAAGLEEGRALRAHFADVVGNKSPTVAKKIGWLKSAVNLAMSERDARLKFNPFAGEGKRKRKKGDVRATDKGIVIDRRLPLNADEMANARATLAQLSASDQLLWVLLASTGMRLGEAFQINSEATEDGFRYVWVGTKTEASLRRIVLPADAIAHLGDKKIDGVLFQGGAPAASKRLNRFLRDIGITDSRKVVHSLRHRARDKLEAAECPEGIIDRILGHSGHVSAGKKYGIGKLSGWIERIGW